MSDKDIKIKDSVYKKYSELTEEEKCIYESRRNDGWTEGGLFTLIFLIVFFIAIIVTMSINGDLK